MIEVYKAKLSEYAIPVEELGFRPIQAKNVVGPAVAAAAR